MQYRGGADRYGRSESDRRVLPDRAREKVERRQTGIASAGTEGNLGIIPRELFYRSNATIAKLPAWFAGTKIRCVLGSKPIVLEPGYVDKFSTNVYLSA